MNQSWSSWRLEKRFWWRKNPTANLPIHPVLPHSPVQVGTEVDDRVYFSPLRGNAWKLRSWNGTSWEAMAMKVLFWFTRKRCLKSSKIWNILTSAPCFQAFFQKLWQLFLLWWVLRSCLAQHSLEPWQYRHWWQVHRLRCTLLLTCQSASGSSSAYFWDL